MQETKDIELYNLCREHINYLNQVYHEIESNLPPVDDKGKINRKLIISDIEFNHNSSFSYKILEKLKKYSDPQHLKIYFDQNQAEVILLSFLRHYFELSNNSRLELDEDAFKTAYFDLEKYLFSDSQKCKISFLIKNFSSDINELHVENGLALQKISEERYKELNRSGIRDFFDIHYELSIEYERKYDFIPLFREISPEYKLDQVISAFRFFKYGDIIPVYSVYEPLEWDPYFNSIFTSIKVNQRFKGYGSLYEFSKTEIDQFTEFWKRFNKVVNSENNRLRVAIYRYQKVCEEEDIYENIIDIMIAFQSIIGSDKKIKEKVPELLECNENERENIQSILGKAWKLRNKVVHGGEVNNLYYSLEKFIKTKEVKEWDEVRADEKLVKDAKYILWRLIRKQIDCLAN